MRTLDFTPLYRTVIGADRLSRLLDAGEKDSNTGYPPYNIEVIADNEYKITLALAGFQLGDLSIQQENNVLTVSGGKQPEQGTPNYLYQGIATRDFERKFQLADHVEVKSASFENGLLVIDLVREIPDAMKPRKIAINTPDLISN